MPKFSYMDDCIHLHACRRVQAIGKKLRLMCPRYCDENCECYLSSDTETNYVSIDEALEYACNGAYSIQSGYDIYDVYCSGDLNGASIGEIVEDAEE